MTVPFVTETRYARNSSDTRCQFRWPVALFVALVAAPMIAPRASFASKQFLVPQAATQVEAGSHNSLNFGVSTSIYAGAGYSRTLYIRFNLSGIPLARVTAAELKIVPNGNRISQTISVYGL